MEKSYHLNRGGLLCLLAMIFTLSHLTYLNASTLNTSLNFVAIAESLLPPEDDVDIQLSIISNHDETNVGQQFSYILTITNNGPAHATGVQVNFSLPPAFVTYASHISDQTTYNPATGLWSIGNLNKNVTRTLLVNVEVLVGGNISATAEVTATNETDVDSTPNNGVITEDDMVSVDVLGLQIDLELFLELAPGQSSVVPVGGNVTYLLHVENKGPTVGYNTKIRAILAADVFSYVSSTVSMGTYLDALGVWVIGDIPPFATQTMEITATVIKAGTHTYTCEARTSNVPDVDSTPSNYDPNEDDISSVTISTSGVVLQTADLRLMPSSDQFITIGGLVTFTLTIINDGPDDATGVSIADVLPAELALQTATPSMGTYSAGIWNVGNLANGESETLQIAALAVAENFTSIAPIYYFAQIQTSDQEDTDSTPGNDTNQSPNEDDERQIELTPYPSADLEVSAEFSSDVAAVGDSYVLTVNIANNGPSDATNVIVTNQFPSAYLSVTNQTTSKGIYTTFWTIENLNSGETATLTFEGTVGSFTEPITYFAQVQDANPTADPDSDPGNDINQTPNEDDEALATLSPVVTSNADLRLIVASGGIVSAGDTYTLTVNVLNEGPDDATSVSIADVLPSELTIQTVTPSIGTYDAGIWKVGDLTNGEGATLQIEVLVGDLTETVYYFAQIQTSDQNDLDSTPGNDSDQTPNEDDEVEIDLTPAPISTDIDLELNISANKMEFNLYENITYTIAVTNKGPVTATGVKIASAVPSGMAFTSKTISKGSYNLWVGLWTVGELNAGETATLEMVLFTLNNSGTISNFVQVKAANQDDSDSTPNNNSLGVPIEDDEASVSIIPAGSTNNMIDLALSKTASVSTAKVGDAIAYTIVVVNNGTTQATGVQVEDLVPSSLTIVNSVASKGNYDNESGTWLIGTIGIGGSVTLVINTTVNAIALPITNFAQVKSAFQEDVDSTPFNNSTTTPQEDDEDSVTVLPDISGNFVDIELTVEAGSGIPAGNPETLIITVTNNGPADAVGVTVAYDSPQYFYSIYEVVSKGILTSDGWTVGNLASGETASVIYQGTVDIVTEPVVFFAQVQTASPQDSDSTPGNDTDQTPDEDDEAKTVFFPPGSTSIDLEATMTSSQPNLNIYTNVTFTLEVTNKGATTATGVLAEFPIPLGMAFTSKTVSIGSYNLWSKVWSIGSLQPNETAVLELTLFVLNQSNDKTLYAEVTAANENDFDSTPDNGNGSSVVEDDEAAVTVLANGSSGGKGDLDSQVVGESTLLTVHRLYPVPTRDVVNILFTSEAQTIDIMLYDYSGRNIYHQTLEVAPGANTTQLDLTSFPAGWYFVSMETEEGSVRTKVLKQ
ncbi:MAG: T9SS type A sorting domain-containing protein [Chitinophagales bacterium]